MDLGLGKYQVFIQTRHTKEGPTVFDPLRKKYVALTPEEFVRQLLVCYLHEEKGISYSRMISERKVEVMGSNQRFDLAVFDSHGRVSLLAECKSFRNQLVEEDMLQAFRYNNTMEASCILVTNGRQTFCYTKSEGDNRWTNGDLIPAI